MRRISANLSLLFSLPMILATASPAHGFQAPSVGLDRSFNSSAPEAHAATSSGQASLAYSPQGSAPPPSRQDVASPEAASLAPANRYQLWKDPAEGAFSVSLPVDWTISGGTVRPNRIDAHYIVRAQSPDGSAQLFMDDPGILMREVPNQATRAMGVQIGQVMPTGLGTNLVVEPYRPGDQFAAEYVRQSLCPSAAMMHGGSIVDQTKALNAQLGSIAQLEGKTLRAEAGEVSFKCGTRAGYVYAITVQAGQPDGAVSIWGVYRIAGYLANPEASAAAAESINRMLGTFQMNQAWLRNYAQECGDTAGIMVRESNIITQTTVEREQSMSAAMRPSSENSHRNSEAVSNAAAGPAASAPDTNGSAREGIAQLKTKKVCDELGRCQTVDANVTNWWSDCSGAFYPGPDSGSPPPASQSACWSKGH